MVDACWVKGTSPYAKAYDNRGRPCKVYGTTDYVVAIAVFVVLAVILLGLSAGWIIRYSRRASKFRAFWNQPTQDYELKQHHAALLKQGGMKSDDASSIRSKVSVATTVPKSTSTAHHHGRSPLATYEDVNVGDRQYMGTGYGDGGMGSTDFNSGRPLPTSPLAQQQAFRNNTQPWQNFGPAHGDLGYPSTSQVNLHAPADERAGFLYDDHRSSFDYNIGPPAQLPSIGSFNPGGPQPYNPYGGAPVSQQPRYSNPYGPRGPRDPR